MNEFGIGKLRGVVRRRKVPVAVATIATLGIGLALVSQVESGYKAGAVIRAVEAQPAKEYVPPTVVEPIGTRLRSLRLAVMARAIVEEAARAIGLDKNYRGRDFDQLVEFNARENLLARPFRVRQGIHTGSSFVDRVRGVAYSPVLDVAGHLQKHAPVDGLLVSSDTLACLPETMRFSAVGEVGREHVTAHRLESIAQRTTPPGEE